MATTTADFGGTLHELVATRKKHHPFEVLVTSGKGTQKQVLCYLTQHYIFKREFPRFLAGIIAGCPEVEVRQELSANLFEEETGKLSKSAPHAQLWLRLCASVGYDAEAISTAEPLPGTREILDWLETATVRRGWLEGAAAVNIGLEALPPSVLEQLKQSPAREFWLVRHYAKPDMPPDLDFVKVHRELEESHGDVGYAFIARYARTREDQDKAIRAVEKTIDMWKVFNDSMEQASG